MLAERMLLYAYIKVARSFLLRGAMRGEHQILPKMGLSCCYSGGVRFDINNIIEILKLLYKYYHFEYSLVESADYIVIEVLCSVFKHTFRR